MSSPLFADRPAPQPPERGEMDALINRTRLLRGSVDAVRRNTAAGDDDAVWRWQRALCDLAVHQLDDLGAHLNQLKAGRPDQPQESAAPERPLQDGTPPSRVGSAEWDLLSDEATWSDELYQIFGRPPECGPMSLDELPSLVFPEDRALLTAMVTGCLIDGSPIDGEFRVVRPDGQIRTLHMMGEPVLDGAGATASMWAVLRDVSELRRSERAVSESRDSVRRVQHIAQTERRLVTELQEAVLPSRTTSLRLTRDGRGALDLTAHWLPAANAAPIGGDWYDALELPDGDTLLTVGDLTGHGVGAASTMAMLLGALRGLAVAGIEPGALLGHLNRLLDTAEQPALGSALCARYRPATRTLVWAQAASPAPLLFRDGTGRALTQPDGVLLGATSGAGYEQAGVQLKPGDTLVLHTDGLARTDAEAAGQDRLLALAPRLTASDTSQAGARAVVGEFGGSGRDSAACVMVARIG
ncbi:phosphatase [Streptomyces sp. AcH 505]|uniref:PP2C family protein-serine/threonine phosphatase n=1 Tax=Streptomyces sp. AcH 505 TaxID=352211 RepID=UPI0005920D82|nr:phosphatase [Streptomyces sp. AcH 505]